MRWPVGPLAVLFCAAIAIAPAAWAANIVTDPGFENEDASAGSVPVSAPWIAGAANSIVDVGVEEGFVNSGNNAAFIGYGTLSQVLTTVVGATYTVSFFVGINDAFTLTDPNATFDATVSGSALGSVDLFGGVPLTPGPPNPGSFIQCPNPGSPCSAETTDTFTAADTTTTLTFTGLTSLDVNNNPLGVWYVDDVDVEAQAQAAPEPPGIAVLALGLGLLTLIRARRA